MGMLDWLRRREPKWMRGHRRLMHEAHLGGGQLSAEEREYADRLLGEASQPGPVQPFASPPSPTGGGPGGMPSPFGSGAAIRPSGGYPSPTSGPLPVPTPGGGSGSSGWGPSGTGPPPGGGPSGPITPVPSAGASGTGSGSRGAGGVGAGSGGAGRGGGPVLDVRLVEFTAQAHRELTSAVFAAVTRAGAGGGGGSGGGPGPHGSPPEDLFTRMLKFDTYKAGVAQILRGFTANTPTSTASDVLGGVGQIAMAMGKGPAGQWLQLMSAVAGSADAIRAWTDNLHKANMQFAQFSGPMAQVGAEALIRQIDYEQTRGENREDDARRLSESNDRVREKWGVIEDRWNHLKTNVAVWLNDQVLEPLAEPTVEGRATRTASGMTAGALAGWAVGGPWGALAGAGLGFAWSVLSEPDKDSHEHKELNAEDKELTGAEKAIRNSAPGGGEGGMGSFAYYLDLARDDWTSAYGRDKRFPNPYK